MGEELREVYTALLARAPENKIEPDLTRIRRILDLMGNPERAYRTVHIAGTNGKTSTARITERILRQAGLRTGRMTSPHLHSVTERVAVDGKPLPEDEFVQAYRDIEPFLEIVDAQSLREGGPRMTFFEVLTALSFQALASAPVDVAVVETGLGGSWDATNVISPDAAVITSIGYDHQEYLGHDITDIAGEKAGILTADALGIIAHQERSEAREVILERAEEIGATLALEGDQIVVLSRVPGVGGQQISVQAVAGRYEDLFLSLLGEHQAHNALLAIAAAEAVLTGGERELDHDLLREALADVSSPGRAEVVRQSPTILVDAAHNPDGAAALVETVRESFRFTHVVGVVGVLEDKDAEQILAALEPLCDEVVVTRSSSPRALPADELADIARDVFDDDDRVVERPRLDDAIQAAVDLAESRADAFGGVVCCGSVTIAAEARALLRREGDE
nr:folylpolyglutamate synthase/dihydrofolate synthase family protein [Devriesea agamarum]